MFPLHEAGTSVQRTFSGITRMAFGDDKEIHFFGGLLVCVASLITATVFGDISLWLRIGAWLVAWCAFWPLCLAIFRFGYGLVLGWWPW
jgi:hypothetical protein